MHVLGFDPHAFAHFRDERKRRLDKVFAAFVGVFTMQWYIIDLQAIDFLVYFPPCLMI